MKILLIATNQAERYMDRMVVRPLPIGVAYLAAHVDEGRHELRVLDLMFSDDAVSEVRGAVEQFRPDLVGLSIRNLDNQSYLNPVSHLPRIKEIVRQLRSVTDATIVCGGPAFSILPAYCLEYLEADLGIAGDGVESFTLLVDCLHERTDYTGIAGLVYRDGAEIIALPTALSSDFRQPPRLDLLDLRRYDKAGFGVGVVTKLAGYYYPTQNGRGAYGGEGSRVRPVEEIIEEVSRLNAENGIRKLFFIDSAFNVPMDHAKGLCARLIDSSLSLRWNTYLRPGDCDEELTSLMKSSGCSLALIAGREPDGQSDDLGSSLDSLGGLRELADLCRSAGLPFALTMAFGTPGETEHTVSAKLDFLKLSRPQFATLRLGTRVLPGSEVADLARGEGLIGLDADLLMPTFYIEPGVREWLADRVRQATAEEPRWNAL